MKGLGKGLHIFAILAAVAGGIVSVISIGVSFPYIMDDYLSLDEFEEWMEKLAPCDLGITIVAFICALLALAAAILTKGYGLGIPRAVLMGLAAILNHVMLYSTVSNMDKIYDMMLSGSQSEAEALGAKIILVPMGAGVLFFIYLILSIIAAVKKPKTAAPAPQQV